MQYQGGKGRIGRTLASIIVPAGLAKGNGTYVEPFMGALGVSRHVAKHARRMDLSDFNGDMADLWRALLDGWVAPSSVTEDEYNALKSAESSPLRTFAAVGCSFGAKWFGGYARDRRHYPSHGGEYNYAFAASRKLAAIVADMRKCLHVNVAHVDYRNVRVKSGDTVYCDPPYAATIGYKGAGEDFDSVAFWATMDKWHAKGARIFVSEFNAPDHWVAVWGKPRDEAMHGTASATDQTDCLFVHADYALEVLNVMSS